MTKTLTEQWRDGTLKSGNYYTVCYKGWSEETFPCNLYYSERIGFDANVKEVLAPVPSYDEYKKLQEQLKSANNAMKSMLPFANNYPKERIEKYLKKWGVK